MPLWSLKSYRVGLNVTELETQAQALLAQATSVDALAERLGWTEVNERTFVEQGFAPQSDASEFLKLFQQVQQRTSLRDKRETKGYTSWSIPRKGWKGWWQKRRDDEESPLATTITLLEWLSASPRWSLLQTMHDAVLNNVALTAPREIPYEEIFDIASPIAQMIEQLDLSRAQRIVYALKAPLNQVDPQSLIHDLAGYVYYEPERGFAYYYA